MNKTLAMIASALCLAAAAAQAKAPSSQEFVEKASISDRFEIESSRLALEKSQSQNIKEFAQKMIDDHTKSSEQLKATLPQSQVPAGVAKETLDARHAQIMKRLQSADGAEFDREYIAAQKKAHDEAVSLFSAYSKDGADKALKGFAGQTLPTLKEHQEHVKDLSAS